MASAADVTETYERLGDLLHWTGQYAVAHDVYGQALASQLAEEVVACARLQRKQANSLREQYRYPEALQLYAVALACLETDEPQWLRMAPGPARPRDSSAGVSEPDPTWLEEWFQVQLEILSVYYWLGDADSGLALYGRVQPVIGSIGVGPMVEGWIAQPECGGGPLLYVGSHLVDQVLWLLDDDPIEVSADVRTRLDTGAEETAAFQIEFARGATAQCLVTQAAAGFFNNLDIVGREGHIGVRSTGFLDYTIEVMSKTQPAYNHPAVIRPGTAGDRILMMHVPQLEAFATAIGEQRQPDVSIAEARRVLAVLDAVVESGRTGEMNTITGKEPLPVSDPLANKDYYAGR